jgi:hypothetical protein
MAKVDADIVDDPFGETRVDATLTEKTFRSEAGCVDDNPELVGGLVGLVSSSGPSPSSEDRSAPGHVPKIKAAWRSHAAVWMASSRETTLALEEAGKDFISVNLTHSIS